MTHYTVTPVRRSGGFPPTYEVLDANRRVVFMTQRKPNAVKMARKMAKQSGLKVVVEG